MDMTDENPAGRAGPPLWQHYIPRMYLQAWHDPREDQLVIWVYKQGSQPRRKGRKGVGAADGFYVSEMPGEENTTELALAKIESDAAVSLRKLRDGDIVLTQKERAEFSTFLAITSLRTKAAREHIDSVYLARFRQRLAKLLREGKIHAEEEGVAAEVASGKKQLIQTSKGWSIKTAFQEALKLDPLLGRVPWGLLKAPDGEAFITSDNPLRLWFEHARLQRFAFPISPRFLLMGDVSNRGDGQADVSRDRVADCNIQQVEGAHKEVYASFCCDDLQELLDESFATRAAPILKPPPGMPP